MDVVTNVAFDGFSANGLCADRNGDGGRVGRGLSKKNSTPILILFCCALFFANALNVGADISAMADGAEMLGAGSSHLWVIVFGIITAAATVRLRYTFIAGTLKWLASFLFAYVVTALIAKPDWRETLMNTFNPAWLVSSAQWSMLVAIMGTTISPYLFFWQASQEVEEEKAMGREKIEQRIGATPSEIQTRRYDVVIGTFFSNFVMYFIILSAAVTLHRHGLTEIETSKQAAQALVPIAGRFSAWLYTIGLLGVGFLAIPTLTGSAAYAFAETFGWNQGLDAPVKKARGFYAAIVASTLCGVIFDFSNINPIQALYWSAIINGLLAPFILVILFSIVRDKKIMHGQTSSPLSQIGIGLSLVIMFAAGIAMFVSL